MQTTPRRGFPTLSIYKPSPGRMRLQDAEAVQFGGEVVKMWTIGRRSRTQSWVKPGLGWNHLLVEHPDDADSIGLDAVERYMPADFKPAQSGLN